MNDKKRLESIKKKFSAQRSVNARAYESLDLYDLSYEEGDWLIEQAEKVEQLEQEIASLKEALNASVKTSVALINDKELEKFVCEHCGKPLNPKDEYHLTFNVCNEDCYMEMIGLSWGDFI